VLRVQHGGPYTNIASPGDFKSKKRNLTPPDLLTPKPMMDIGFSPSASYGSVHRASVAVNDVDQLALAFQGWDVRFQQFDAGRLSGRIDSLRTEHLTIVRFQLNRAVLASGVNKRGDYAVTPVETGNQGALWRGRELSPGELNVLPAGAEMSHLTSGGAYDNVTLLVEPQRLRQAAATLWRADLPDLLPLARRPPSGHAIPQLREFGILIRNLLYGLAPLIGPAPTTTPRSVVEEACLEHLLDLIAGPQQSGAKNLTGARRRRLAEEAAAFMLADLKQPVSMERLASAFDVSKRTLLYAFRERFRSSPMAFLKIHRLNAVRRELRSANLTRGVVGEIAARYGFWHTGQFAADYRRLFGKSPHLKAPRRS
jgi:AraC family ethanolamine operon transcriptional activator